nr:60S ribosomal protein L34 [Tanacetum cinerariifolium]
MPLSITWMDLSVNRSFTPFLVMPSIRALMIEGLELYWFEAKRIEEGFKVMREMERVFDFQKSTLKKQALALQIQLKAKQSKWMTVARLSKMLQGTCMFPVQGIFFLVLSKELSNGLIQIKNDLDLANCIAIGYKNGKVIDMFLEHHGYDLSHWIQTDIDNNDDKNFDVEMEDITGYAVSDFVRKDDVVIPNRSINDPFLNKLCNGSYINDFSDKPDVGESSQPCGKELQIDSDDEDVGKQFKLVDGVIYPAFNLKLPWNEMKPTMGLRFEHPEQLKDCLTNYGVANGYQLWYRRNDYRSLFVLYGRDLAEGRSGGKKGKKGD